MPNLEYDQVCGDGYMGKKRGNGTVLGIIPESSRHPVNNRHRHRHRHRQSFGADGRRIETYLFHIRWLNNGEKRHI